MRAVLFPALAALSLYTVERWALLWRDRRPMRRTTSLGHA